MEKVVKTDVLVIGAGAAGTRAALESYDNGASVTIALKGRLGFSGATAYGVSEIAAFNVADGDVDPLDDPDVHYRDIIEAGLGMCDERLARILVDEAYPRMKELEKWEVVFEKDNDKYLEIRACFSSKPRAHIIKGHGIPIVKALGQKIKEEGLKF